MNLKSSIKFQLNSLIRNVFVYFYSIFVYIFLALWDMKNSTYISDTADYINRFNFQQSIIVFSSLFIVLLVINEKLLSAYREFYMLYVGDAKQYFRGIIVVLYLINIVPFIIGQVVAAIINGVHNGSFPIKLWLVNIAVVSMEILLVLLLEVSLVILVKKLLLVCTIYYVIIILLLVVNNIYISVPMTISLLESKGYYYTFAYPLWVGKIVQVIVAFIVFEGACRTFIKTKI